MTLMSSEAPTAYLDSWFELFPSELTAPCQVVSTLMYRDPEGSTWRFRHVDIKKGVVSDGLDKNEPPILVRNGDFVMLTHIESERSLRSHGYRAPYTKRLFQVCAYGDVYKDIFVVEISFDSYFTFYRKGKEVLSKPGK